jgi:hypothetical protein
VSAIRGTTPAYPTTDEGLGVLISSGAVAFGIISLLPVELIL